MFAATIGHRAGWLSLVLLCLLAGGRMARAQGFPPQEAVRRMTAAAGLQVRLVASEPQVRQPILVKVDDRGRLWTIQYLQYPNPAGLKRVKVDRWSRTTYDRVPKPPPHGPRGADRITILADTNGDGRADRIRDFVDGLNLATGLAFGHGGVYVLQVPYLLFYPDRDRDDRPDGNPRVLLKGFGMEDAQSLANHLTWGPDGWLYGVNGSTTTCRIRGIEFQQGVWRYHPRSDRFELFCEGGGNTFGLTFDENGNLYQSTNGGPFLDAWQGAYYGKSFGKHGPLHNLYAYGYLGLVPRDKVPGGPPTGGTIYLGDTFPSRFRGRFLAGNFLGHTAAWWDLTPQQSTVRARYGGVLLNARDSWFGPTDMCLGPDGAMYVSDFYDRRTSHPDPDAAWDRSNGRIYRIEATGAARTVASSFDLHRASSKALVSDFLRRKNRWFADRARVELAARRDASTWPALRAMARKSDNGPQALQGLWALAVSGGLDEATALQLLRHPYAPMRAWVVRLLGDDRRVTAAQAKRLEQLARSDPAAPVLTQLAATAKRLPQPTAQPLLHALLDRPDGKLDARQRWMLWWAIEAHAGNDREQLARMFVDAAPWRGAAWRENAGRLARRWAAEGVAASYAACERLLAGARAAERPMLLSAVAQGLDERGDGGHGLGQGGLFQQFATRDGSRVNQRKRSYEPVGGPLRERLLAVWRKSPSDPLGARLGLRVDPQTVAPRLRQELADRELPDRSRAALLQLLAPHFTRREVPTLLRLLESRSQAVRAAALRGVERLDDPRLTAAVVRLYPTFPPLLKSQARGLLLSRKASARALLQAVDAGRIAAKEIPVVDLRRVSEHADPQLQRLVLRHWGNIRPGTPEEKLATMRRYNNDLRTGVGNVARGKRLFAQHCANCHKLFGEGKSIGPDLTSTSRKDRAALLANLVDPSAVIRRDYLSYQVRTVSGRVLTGLIADRDAASITLVDNQNRRTRLLRGEIETLRESPVSLMPENLIDKWTPQQRRDLFAYLQK